MNDKVHTEYTAERIIKALDSQFWLEKDVCGHWRLGLGIRGVGRGVRVPTKEASKATKDPRVETRDTAMGVIYVAKKTANERNNQENAHGTPHR